MNRACSKGCIVIGLTGSSGSGKSEAARALSELGAQVIDADSISHAVVETEAALGELSAAFGSWVIDGQGRFNRQAVSERAFADKIFLAELTRITHRYIIEEIYRRVGEYKSLAGGVQTGAMQPPPCVVVIDAPIPVEKGFLDLADAVWVVAAPRASRLERVVRRDGIAAAAAEARFMSQLGDGEYEALADVVIYNTGSVADLARKIKSHLEALIA